MDAFYEEDERIVGHAATATRIDIRQAHEPRGFIIMTAHRRYQAADCLITESGFARAGTFMRRRHR